MAISTTSTGGPLVGSLFAIHSSGYFYSGRRRRYCQMQVSGHVTHNLSDKKRVFITGSRRRSARRDARIHEVKTGQRVSCGCYHSGMTSTVFDLNERECLKDELAVLLCGTAWMLPLTVPKCPCVMPRMHDTSCQYQFETKFGNSAWPT